MRIARAVPGLVAALVLLGAFGCGRGAPAESLLAGKLPARADGVANPALLTDGQQASEGDGLERRPRRPSCKGIAPSSNTTSGKSVPIAAAYLQGDNNDDYVVASPRTAPASASCGSRARSPPRACAGAPPTAWTGRGAGSGCPRAAATASTR